MRTPFGLILVDHLQSVSVDIVLVQQVDVGLDAVVAHYLDGGVVFLYQFRLVLHRQRSTDNLLLQFGPLCIGVFGVVGFAQLEAQILHQLPFVANAGVLIALAL